LRARPARRTGDDHRPAPGGGTGAVPTIPGFAGAVLTAEDDGYEQGRTVWNGAVDRRPLCVARCSGVADVVAALRFARERDLPLAVRSGGQGIAGTSVCDDGVVIDLSPMKAIRVDPAGRSVHAEAGVVWKELDGVTQLFGLATTGSIHSGTGIAGMTLGGGVGWLMRRHGLTVDNLLEVEVVGADGQVLTAGETSHPDLFWGLRGGGGNFGIATSFTYRLHPVGPEVLAGSVLWPMDDAPALLRYYREFAATAPPEVGTVVTLRRAPDASALPPELRGRPVCIVDMAYLGDPGAGEDALAPLRGIRRPLLDGVDLRPYTALQSMVDALAPRGWHYSVKAADLTPLADPVADVIVEHAWRSTSPRSYTSIYHLGGAIAAAGENATAYSHRDAAHSAVIVGAWLPHEALAARETAWVRGFFGALQPYEAGASINFLDRDDQERVPSAYGGDTYRRLQALKGRYDPGNVFRLDQNIAPVARVQDAADRYTGRHALRPPRAPGGLLPW
ncbi:MAG: FAD-binding oxidoreductase, partial [Actinomycetota bacterium]